MKVLLLASGSVRARSASSCTLEGHNPNYSAAFALAAQLCSRRKAWMLCWRGKAHLIRPNPHPMMAIKKQQVQSIRACRE